MTGAGGGTADRARRARAPRDRVDLAIIGGGCAGLALATRLTGAGLEVVVIEPRETYPDDRRWSYWRPEGAPPALVEGFGGAVAGRWSQWRLDDGGRDAVIRRSAAQVYETVSAGPYAEAALERIAATPGMTHLAGTRAHGIAPHPAGGWRVETDSGTITAARVVDTRPPETVPAYVQAFEGAEIAVDGAAFDPTTVGLMSFRPARAAGAIDFVYTLPVARDRALVEVTRFGPQAPAPGGLDPWLDEEIAAAAGGRSVTVERRERGRLPMAIGHAAPGGPGSHVRLGLGGGAARPSTGYAFQRIQRAAGALADQIRAGHETLAVPADGPATRWMDALFLSVLARAPERGPALFLSLFAHAPRDRVERFLSGSTAPLDRLAVIAAMPPAPFLSALAAPRAGGGRRQAAARPVRAAGGR